MGEYQGRRRGRSAPEPGYRDPGYQDPGYQDPAPAPEPYYPAVEDGYPDPEPSYFAEEDYYYPAPAPDYSEPDQYPETQYSEAGYPASDYPDPEYAEPRFEPLRRRARDAGPEVPAARDARDFDDVDARDFDDVDARRQPRGARGPRTGAGAPNHLPLIAATAVAFIAASFVSPVAVAVVTALAQAAVVRAVLDLVGFPSRRAAVVALLPALAADAACFHFAAADAATGIAAGLGCGFVLAAADSVLRARRHGVEPGASKMLASTVTASLVACLTGLFVAAGRLEHPAVAVGGVVAASLAYAASRNRELSVSRVAVVALPCAAAALAAYAAAILMA